MEQAPSNVKVKIRVHQSSVSRPCLARFQHHQPTCRSFYTIICGKCHLLPTTMLRKYRYSYYYVAIVHRCVFFMNNNNDNISYLRCSEKKAFYAAAGLRMQLDYQHDIIVICIFNLVQWTYSFHFCNRKLMLWRRREIMLKMYVPNTWCFPKLSQDTVNLTERPNRFDL